MLLLASILAAASPTTGAVCSASSTGADMVKGKDLTGQTHVLTGGDSGIGFETALALASVNASVIILSYDAKGCGAAAAANITALTRNPKVRSVQADLADLKSVRAGAASVIAAVDMINVLICDAGIAVDPRALPPTTVDGYDQTFQVNFLGHFLLVELLLPKIRAAEGRVIHVSSEAQFDACAWANRPDSCVELGNIEASAKITPANGTNPLGVPTSNYGFTKYLQVFHAAELARREHQQGPPMGAVLAFSLHPGFVLTPMTRSTIPPAVAKQWCVGEPQPCPLNAAEGAATPAYIAAADYDAVMPTNGGFYEFCSPAPSVRDIMLNHTGSVGTLAYQAALYDKFNKWVSAA